MAEPKLHSMSEDEFFAWQGQQERLGCEGTILMKPALSNRE